VSLAGEVQLTALLTFSCDRALAPILWAFASIMAVELVIVHIFVSALWSVRAAAILSALSLAALVWLVVLIRSLKHLPVVVDRDGVTMRVGSIRSVRVPRDRIAGVRTAWAREALKQRSVLNLALMNYPNIMLDLDPPLPARSRNIEAVAHRLDDPAGFVAAVDRLLRISSGEK
jgi:hypothetical protein